MVSDTIDNANHLSIVSDKSETLEPDPPSAYQTLAPSPVH
jgi:hypothetical protein